MSDEEKKENPLDGIKQEMNRLLRQQWEQRHNQWRAEMGKEPVEASSGELPDLVKKSMQSHPEAFGLSKDGESAASSFSQHVEERATAILADSDIDREAAKLLLDHHKTALDAALGAKDFDAAHRAHAEVTSHQQAVNALSKPKGHFTRQEFERKQAEAVSREGGLNR